MRTRTKSKKKIFVSHSQKDKPFVCKLANALKSAGVEVWVDFNDIQAGDNLPKSINNALEWCNVIILVWSFAASKSYWVELEWSNAIAHKKKIVPCCFDKTPVPCILAGTVHIDFDDFDDGLKRLLQSLGLDK